MRHARLSTQSFLSLIYSSLEPGPLLLIISEVWTMNTMRHARLSTQSFLSLIYSSLEPGPLLLLLIIFTSNILLALLSFLPLTPTLIGATLLSLAFTPTFTLFLFRCSTISSSFWFRCCSFFLLFSRLARLLGFLLLLRLFPCRALFLIFLFFLGFPISNFIFLFIN